MAPSARTRSRLKPCSLWTLSTRSLRSWRPCSSSAAELATRFKRASRGRRSACSCKSRCRIRPCAGRAALAGAAGNIRPWLCRSGRMLCSIRALKTSNTITLWTRSEGFGGNLRVSTPVFPESAGGSCSCRPILPRLFQQPTALFLGVDLCRVPSDGAGTRAELRRESTSSRRTSGEAIGNTISPSRSASTKTVSAPAAAATVADVCVGLTALLVASTIPEFLEITWANSASTTITATAKTAGKPFTQTSAGSHGKTGSRDALATLA